MPKPAFHLQVSAQYQKSSSHKTKTRMLKDKTKTRMLTDKQRASKQFGVKLTMPV